MEMRRWVIAIVDLDDYAVESTNLRHV
jgi:hypothetical protein